MLDAAQIEQAYEAFNRRDADALKALAHPAIEIHPLISGVTSSGPWSGHDAVDRLVEEARTRWSRFDMRPCEITINGDHAFVVAKVETAAGDGGVVVAGEVTHRLDVRDGLVVRFEARRGRLTGF